jgi:hypothetical protein
MIAVKVKLKNPVLKVKLAAKRKPISLVPKKAKPAPKKQRL